MLFNSYSYDILDEQFHWIYLQGDIKLLLVTVNNRLKFEIEIVQDLLCHPILCVSLVCYLITFLDNVKTVVLFRGDHPAKQQWCNPSTSLFLPSHSSLARVRGYVICNLKSKWESYAWSSDRNIPFLLGYRSMLSTLRSWPSGRCITLYRISSIFSPHETFSMTQQHGSMTGT